VFAGGSSAPFVFFGFFALLAPESAIPSAAGIASTVGAGNTNVVRRTGRGLMPTHDNHKPGCSMATSSSCKYPPPKPCPCSQLGVLGTCGALCMAAGAPSGARQLQAHALLRDSICWAATVLVLGGVFADGRVHWWVAVGYAAKCRVPPVALLSAYASTGDTWPWTSFRAP
jgi:hypothetical protein